MHKNATKCNKTQSKWCINKHGASKIIDTFETYQARRWSGSWSSQPRTRRWRPRWCGAPGYVPPPGLLESRAVENFTNVDSEAHAQCNAALAHVVGAWFGNLHNRNNVIKEALCPVSPCVVHNALHADPTSGYGCVTTTGCNKSALLWINLNPKFEFGLKQITWWSMWFSEVINFFLMT
jgi:hypothetical protein